MPDSSATVEVLTAEVRALMIGKRQVTLSVYRQLDTVDDTLCDPFGRVRDSQSLPRDAIHVVGRHKDTGSLVRSCIDRPERPDVFNRPSRAYDWFKVGPAWSPKRGYHNQEIWKRDVRYGDELVFTCGDWSMPFADVPDRPTSVAVVTEGPYVFTAVVPSQAPTDLTIKPGSVAYKSAEAAAEAQQTAKECLAEVQDHCRVYAEWSALPLIVLAGLR